MNDLKAHHIDRMRVSPIRPTSIVALVAALALFTACSTSEPADSTTSPTTPSTSASTSAPSTTTTTTTTTIPLPPKDDGTAALEFFRDTEAACAAHAQQTGNPVLPPASFSGAVAVEDRGNGAWVIADGTGQLLLVDPQRGVVHHPDGEMAELPLEYSFGCPETLYLGSLHE